MRFSQDEMGKLRKLSLPWRSPFRIVSRGDPDVTVVKVYFPKEGPLQVHQSRVCPCSSACPLGFTGMRKSSGLVGSKGYLKIRSSHPMMHRVRKNKVSANQSDNEPDSDSEDLVPAAGDTNAAEVKSSGAMRNHQSSCYSLRARIDHPDRLH